MLPVCCRAGDASLKLTGPAEDWQHDYCLCSGFALHHSHIILIREAKGKRLT